MVNIPPDEQSQTRKHQSIQLWLHRQIPRPYLRAATSKYLGVEHRKLNVKQVLSVIFKQYCP